MDEVFGEKNYEGTLIWKTKTAAKGVPPLNMLVVNHDYIVVYSKDKKFRFLGEERDYSKFSNPDNDPRGIWKADNMKSTVSENYFTITDPKTGQTFRKNWAFSAETINKMIAENKIIFPNKKDGTPRQKRFKTDYINETTPLRTLIGEFQSETATNKLKKIFNNVKVFDFPKPVELIKLLIKQSSKKDSIILDFFAGSGTTGQAVMELNAEDGGGRKCILVSNNENNIGKAIMYERIYRVVNGRGTKGETFDWTYTKSMPYLINNSWDVFEIESSKHL
jgi:adenine-specific DNA-methyltransferase